MGQQTGIWANRLGFGPTGWDLGQQARNWADRLGIGPTDWDLDLEDEIGALSPGGDRWTDRGMDVHNSSPLCSTGHPSFVAAAQKG